MLVVTLVPAWRAGRLPTTAALARVPPHRRRGARLRRRVAHLPIGVPARSAATTALAAPDASVFTCLSVTLAAVAIVVTISMGNTVDRVLGEPAITGDPGLQIDATSVAARRRRRHDPARRVFMDDRSRATSGIEPDVVPFPARSGATSHTPAMSFARHAPSWSNEAIVGWGLLDELGLAVGDRLNVEINGEPLALTVVGWYSESEDSGRVL